MGGNMKKNNFYNKIVVLTTVILFFSFIITPVLGINIIPSIEKNYTEKITYNPKTINLDYSLPPPITTDMTLEESIFRRNLNYNHIL